MILSFLSFVIMYLLVKYIIVNITITVIKIANSDKLKGNSIYLPKDEYNSFLISFAFLQERENNVIINASLLPFLFLGEYLIS